MMIEAWRITRAQNTKLDIQASSLDDVTRQLPEGYYSTFRTFDAGTRVLGLTAHLQRLYEPVRLPEVDESFLRRQLAALLEPFRPAETRVRVMMTKDGQVYIATEPLTPVPRHVYENGVHVETTDLQREDPRLKSTGFITASEYERKHIAQEGIFEALLVKDGYILEGMTSNFFYVAGRAGLGTARDGILLGVTRRTVIEIAQGMGLSILYKPLNQDQVGGVSEAFLTSSSRGIVPVVEIDQVRVGQGSPGPVTKELMAAYDEYVSRTAEGIRP